MELGSTKKEFRQFITKKVSNRAPRKLPKEDLFVVCLRQSERIFEREIASHFKCAVSSVEKSLKKFGVSYKKTLLYREIDEEKRKEFVEEISKIDELKIF